MARPRILIIDLRSQTTLKIERALREAGFRSAVLDPFKSRDWLAAGNPVDGIILSGGDWSVTDEDAPRPPPEIFEMKGEGGRDMPILGICYGHQYLGHAFGGTIDHLPEYSAAIIERKDHPIFGSSPPVQPVWMNHGDCIMREPPEFDVIARSRGTGAIAAIAHKHKPYLGVQFHPEVTQTKYGKEILRAFAQDICGCERDWSPLHIADSIRDEVREAVGSGKATMGFSGGVDSSTLAALVAPVLKERLLGITVDADHLRENELDEIRSNAECTGLQLRILDVKGRVSYFAGIIDAEQKRKKVFQRKIYVPFQRLLGRQFGTSHYLQGTLAPDLIESGATGGAVIKTHHNVGIKMGVPQLHPLKDLFKYEVRALAEELGLPESISQRKPFPGPGLFIRIIGVPVTHELLACVRWADARVQEILRRDRRLWEHISQLVVAYNGAKTVGLKGDGRTYAGSIMVRAVHTLDYMTVEGIDFDLEIWREIKRSVTTHPLVVRALMDSTDKPPGTTEFE